MDNMNLGNTKEPLTEKNANVATVQPVSKLPLFSTPASGLRPPSSIPMMSKRKTEKDEISKRQRLEPSPDSTLTGSDDDMGKTTTFVKSKPVANRALLPGNRRVPNKPVGTKAPVSSAATAKPSMKPGLATAKSQPSSVFVFKGTTQTPAPATVARPAVGKKRPAWDTKGRLEDMEEAMSRHLQQNSSLQTQILQSNERIALLESVNSELKGTVQHSEQLTSRANCEIETLRRVIREKDDEIETLVNKHNRQLSEAEFIKSTLERQKCSLESDLAVARQEICALKSSISQMSAAHASIEAEFSATKVCLEASRQESSCKSNKISELESVIAAQQKCIEDANTKLQHDEMTRRKLHNTILELKGNIRVFSRVRPLIGDEALGTAAGEIPHLHFQDDDPSVLELERLADANPNESVAAFRKGTSNRYQFKFDRVFPPTSSQQEVFEEISQLVQSALDGYNVCIFAYGQTGSGKTYTMEGRNGLPDERGMIPRAVTQIFESAIELESKGWQYEFEVSFLEIYNEIIRDLLGSGKDDVRHEIRLVAAGSSEVHVTDLTTVKVVSEEQVHGLLAKAALNRSVAETKCNEHSSRSHSVFRMQIKGRNTVTEESCNGMLNLIDLAGSERLKESGSQGLRLKETQSINKSLANLGNVIMALANKEKHVPYRDSKLTHLLQNCLGGSSKTLMFVNVSPREECFQETLNSLRFATKVNDCNIGTAQKKSK